MKESFNFPMRRKAWDSPRFAKQFCAATVTAVAGVAAAGTAAYSSYSQKSATDKAQANLAGNQADAYGSKVEPVKYKDNVQLPGYDFGAGVMDYSHAVPMLGALARQQTVGAMRNRDLISGGNASRNLQQEGADINGFLRGDVPPDVQDKINRMVASRTGGAFSPSGPANQSAQADFARKIGMTSTQMVQMGMSAAPQWESLVDAFTYKPQQAYTDALASLRERDSYQTTAAGIQLQRDQNAYLGAVNYNKMKAMPNPQLTGFTNDSLQLNATGAQQQQNMINALLGTVKAGAGAYQQIAGQGDPYGNSGFIDPNKLNSVASTYATPGYTPTFGTTGQGAYFTGYQPS